MYSDSMKQFLEGLLHLCDCQTHHLLVDQMSDKSGSRQTNSLIENKQTNHVRRKVYKL